jgi:tRNA/tmRNA/rRNA uracil-C5-methylase (TrmA/RlmC/RlmD family)
LSYKTGDELEIIIKKIVPRGLGLGFAEKLTVFVPLTAEGDRVRVRLNEVKGRIAFAEIAGVIEPSPDRAAPPCPYFGTCGGCDFQQMNYAAQLEAKLGILRDCLHRIGKIEYEGEIKMIGSPKEFGYRSRAQWHIDTRSKRIGYFKRASHEVIDIAACPILVPELEKTLEELRETIEWESFWGERLEIEAASGDNGEVSIYGEELIEPTGEIAFSAAGEKYRYSARSFFQGNQFLVESLIKAAIGGASGERALDLYCGVGLFSLPLARKFAEVIGVEGNKEAVDFAEKNAASAGITNVKFASAGVGVYLFEKRPKNIDFILLDPPRAGTERGVIDAIVKMRPKQISYVSCEPSILARDLRVFLDKGYKIESISAFDLFPQTHHVETIVRLNSI